jgi:hypothetical protein
MPPAVALSNYISSGILWRIFCQTGIFRGVFSVNPYFHRKDQRSSDVRGGGHYTILHGLGGPVEKKNTRLLYGKSFISRYVFVIYRE